MPKVFVTNNDRMVWVDALRLIAGLSMVGLHATADATGGAFADAEPADRVVPMVLRAFIYTARTELFLMISVFLLLLALQQRPRGYWESIRIQARRLLVPFLFWTLFYAGYNLIKADAFGYSGQMLSQLADPAEWIGYLLLGSVKYHMHFIPTLFALILFFPLFKAAYRTPALGLLIIACLLVKRELDGFIYPNFWGHDALPYLVRAVKIATYTGYGMMAAAFLGLLHKTDEETRKHWLPALWLVGGLLFSVKLVATWKTIQTGEWQFAYTPGYWADFLMPAVLFGLCMSASSKTFPDILSKLAPYSFGIYLSHPVVLDLAEIATRDMNLSPTGLVLTKIGITLPATCLLVWIISRLPALGWTIGLGPLPKLSAKNWRSTTRTEVRSQT